LARTQIVRKRNSVEVLVRIMVSAVFMGMIASVFRVGANLFILPFALLKLSNEEMVAWWAFVALGSASQVSDFGFSPVITRAYSFLWAGASEYLKNGLAPPTEDNEPNYKEIAVLHRAVVKLYRILAALFTILLLGLGGWYLNTGPFANVQNPSAAWVAWIVYALTMGWGLLVSYWEQAANGLNHVRTVQISNVAGGAAYFIVGCLFLYFGMGLLALSIAAACRILLSRMICRWACRDQLCFSNEKGQERIMLKKLWSNAWKFGLMTVGAYLLSSGVLLVGLKSLSPELAQPVGLTYQIGIFLTSIAVLWLQVKLPYLAMLRIKGHHTEMSILFAQRFGLTLLSFLGLSVGLVLFGNSMLEIIGTNKRLMDAPFLIFFACYLFWRLGYMQFGLLVFTENVIPFHWISLVAGLVALGLSVWLVPVYGLWGLLGSSAIAEFAISGWLVYWRGFRSQSLRLNEFINAMLFKERSV